MYLRVSTGAQVDAYGLDAQEAAILDYAAREGLEVVVAYSDEGLSGSDRTRPAMLDMVADAKTGEFEVVLIAKLDRLARDLMGQMVVEHSLKEAGVRLVSVAEPFGSNDPQSVLMRQILGAFAEFERAMITARLVGGRRAKVRGGGWGAGMAPYGYVNTPDKGVAPGPDQEAVLTAFRMREAGSTMQQIADALTAAGYRTKEGHAFKRMQIKRILDHAEFYRGVLTYGDIVTPGNHTPILTTKTEGAA